MVGLSVILENHSPGSSEKKSPQVISKGISIIKSPLNGFLKKIKKNTSVSSSASGFLEVCFLCRQKLLPGKDIYMYKGDTAFCSVECRESQIFMEEEETNAKSGCTSEYNRSLPPTSSSRPFSSSS